MNKQLYKGILLMIISAGCACSGQFLWKLSEKNIFYILIGFGLYCMGALFMITAYKFGEVSVLQPIQSINYVISVFLGYYFFYENITLNKLLGVAFIVAGVFLIAQAGRK